MIIKNNDFWGNFLQFENEKIIKLQEKYADLLKILLNNPKNLIKQKVLIIIFYP